MFSPTTISIIAAFQCFSAPLFTVLNVYQVCTENNNMYCAKIIELQNLVLLCFFCLFLFSLSSLSFFISSCIFQNHRRTMTEMKHIESSASYSCAR